MVKLPVMLGKYNEKIKKLLPVLHKQVRNPYFLIGLITVVIMVSVSGKYILESKTQKSNDSIVAKISSTPTATPSATLTVIPTIIKYNSLKATPTVVPKATNTPTPTGNQMSNNTRTSNPPRMSISYPGEMQSIEFTKPQEEQAFCVVDVPGGGNTEGVQRRYSINDGSWTAYVDTFTLCYEPKDGLNRLQMHYKNKYGDESEMYTRQFYFHRVVATPTPTPLPEGCTPVTFAESKSGDEITVAVHGAWWLSVIRNPEQSSVDFDFEKDMIYLHFKAPNGTVSVYKNYYSSSNPILCASYQFGSK